GHPARGAQYEQIDQVLLAKRLRANDVDLLDPGDLAFVDRKIDRYPVSLQRRYRRRNGYGITPATEILPFKFLFGAIKLGAVENPPVAEADLAQAFDQLVFFEFLCSDE